MIDRRIDPLGRASARPTARASAVRTGARAADVVSPRGRPCERPVRYEDESKRGPSMAQVAPAGGSAPVP